VSSFVETKKYSPGTTPSPEILAHCVTNLRSAHWLASSLKLAARCPVSGCWPSCYSRWKPVISAWACEVVSVQWDVAAAVGLWCSEMEVLVQLLQRDRLVSDGDHCRLHCHYGTALRDSLAVWLDRHVPRVDQLYHVPSKVAYVARAHLIRSTSLRVDLITLEWVWNVCHSRYVLTSLRPSVHKKFVRFQWNLVCT